MAKLNANTIVTHPRTGAPVVLEKGSDVPDWAKDLVGDHLTEPLEDEDGGGDGGPPPQAGRGSGKEAWVAYAESNGVTVDPDATRDDIIAACSDAGIPVE